MKNIDKKSLLYIDTAKTKDKIIRFIRRYVIELNRDGNLEYDLDAVKPDELENTLAAFRAAPFWPARARSRPD